MTAGLATFIFDSTQATLWAEEVAGSAGIPAEVVPAPADSDAKCDLALVTHPSHAEGLETALTDQGVPHRQWTGSR